MAGLEEEMGALAEVEVVEAIELGQCQGSATTTAQHPLCLLPTAATIRVAEGNGTERGKGADIRTTQQQHLRAVLLLPDRTAATRAAVGAREEEEGVEGVATTL